MWHREGSRLDVDRDTNVDEVFGNPCKGVFKVRAASPYNLDGCGVRLHHPASLHMMHPQVLILRYATAEVKGVYRIHVPGPGAPLGQNLRIGWMPGT